MQCASSLALSAVGDQNMDSETATCIVTCVERSQRSRPGIGNLTLGDGRPKLCSTDHHQV